MQMIVTRDTGIIVICGELIRSDFYVDKNSSIRATYHIKTSGTTWTDPTGAPGAKEINWTVSAWSFTARLADPEDSQWKDKHVSIEGIPTYETTITDFWRTPTGRPKKALKLRALFADYISDYDAEDLANRVAWHPPGTKYSPWWRPDNIPDDAPDLLPETVHLSGEEDWGIGFQDDMRSDMEFFYEDERWSRD